MTWLTGCTSAGKLATYSDGDGRLAVDLPAVCDAFLQVVDEPDATRKTDARIAAVRFADAFHQANGRLAGGRDCMADQRAAYRKGKPR